MLPVLEPEQVGGKPLSTIITCRGTSKPLKQAGVLPTITEEEGSCGDQGAAEPGEPGGGSTILVESETPTGGTVTNLPCVEPLPHPMHHQLPGEGAILEELGARELGCFSTSNVEPWAYQEGAAKKLPCHKPV